MYTRKHFNFVRTALMLFFALFVSSNAWADTPKTLSDLQGTITAASAGATITLNSDYTGGAALVVNKEITLDLNGHTIDRNLGSATSNGYVIRVEDTGNLTITGTGTITGGKNSGDGGGIYNAGTLTLQGGTISGNTASGTGGGIYNATSTSVFSMTGGTVSGNTASGGGGGIRNNAGQFTITGGSVTGNYGGSKGGGIRVKPKSGSPATISGCTITGNHAETGNGGGVYLDGNNSGWSDYKLTVTNCIINTNTVKEDGGLGKDYYGLYGEATFEGCTFTKEDNSIYISTTSTSYKVVLADNADNSGMIIPANSPNNIPHTTTVTLKGRTLTKNDSWNTLCLPFNVTAVQLAESTNPLYGATIQELNASNSGLSGNTLTLEFIDATSIEAGKPYIVKWENSSGSVSDPVFTGVTITSTTPSDEVSFTGGKFVGQYSPFSVPNNNIIVIGSGNRIGYSAQGNTLRAFRAHFDMSPTSAPIMNVVFNTEDGQTTAINTVNGSELKVNGEYYNLAGQRVAQPTKGLYIVNGRKVVVK